MNVVQEKSQYWDSFYGSSGKSPPKVPSQFATFAATEFSARSAILEIGCGNGRDAEFFSLFGFNVLAIDASSQAISSCEENRRGDALYKHCQDGELKGAIEAFAQEHDRLCVYGRFFLHAITEEEQQSLIDVLNKTLPATTMLAFEYRTLKDAEAEKEFGTHYRRFIDHARLISTFETNGYDVLYEIEGRGFAKYKDEDAFVGRIVLEKR